MSEWLGKSRIKVEDIEKSLPSLAKYFPMLTRYYENNQKMRLNLVLSYEEGDEFKQAVIKTFGSFNPTNVRRAASEAIREWVKAHS